MVMIFTDFFLLSINKKSIIITLKQGNIFLLLFYKCLKLLQALRKSVLEPRNKTRILDSLPLVQNIQKIIINQSSTVAAIIRKAQKAQNQIKNSIDKTSVQGEDIKFSMSFMRDTYKRLKYQLLIMFKFYFFFFF